MLVSEARLVYTCTPPLFGGCSEVRMKEGIHPAYQEVEVHCACGNTFKTRSTKKEFRLEICSACHPLFTGKQKLIDSAGMVERFHRRYKNSEKA